MIRSRRPIHQVHGTVGWSGKECDIGTPSVVENATGAFDGKAKERAAYQAER